MHIPCGVPTCPKTTTTVHCFPRPNKKKPWKLVALKIWLYRGYNRIISERLSVECVIKNLRICDAHFSDSCKLPPTNKLRRGSLPTLFLPKFSEPTTDTNSQFALLQYCKYSDEMRMFGQNYVPPLIPSLTHHLNFQKNRLISVNTRTGETQVVDEQLVNETPKVYTIPKLSKNEVENNLKNVVLEPKIVTNKNKTFNKPLSVKTTNIINNDFTNNLSQSNFEDDLISIKSFTSEDIRVRDICRICFSAANEETMLKLYGDTDETNEDTKQMKDMLKEILPELNLGLYYYSVICINCKEKVIASYKLKMTWLATENKLKNAIAKEKNNQRKQSTLVVVPINKLAPPDHDYAVRDISSDIKLMIGHKISPLEPATLNQKPVVLNYTLNTTNPLTSIQKSNNTEDITVKEPIKKLSKDYLWGEGPYMCEECGMIYSKKSSLRAHIHRHKIRNRQAMCEECGEILPNTQLLKKHLRYHRATSKKKPKAVEKRQYICNICDKVLTTNTSLQTHIKHMHLKVYNYTQCHLCGKKLRSKGTLSHHLMVHADAKKYSCDVCGKRFNFPVGLRKHMARHSQFKLSCEICGKLIKHQWSLKQHIKVFHMKAGNANCDICGKIYYKKFDLDRHKLKIHGWKPEVKEEAD